MVYVYINKGVNGMKRMCPECNSTRTAPYLVMGRQKPGSRDYGIACSECGHEWSEVEQLQSRIADLECQLAACEARWGELRNWCIKNATFIPQASPDHTEAYRAILDHMDTE